MINETVLLKGDCLEQLNSVITGSVDMIFTDLPYGTTQCKWDAVIPFEEIWKQYNRIIKDNGAIVLTASQPFTSQLITSNIGMFRYEWIWEKNRGGGYLNAKRMPLKSHENVCVFYKKLPKYNPQKTKGKAYKKKRGSHANLYDGVKVEHWETKNSGERYPVTVQKFQIETGYHPTQKPVDLVSYMIKTYTDEGDVVLDSCMGSGTTGVACKINRRKFIGIELDDTYFDIAEKRIEEANMNG